MYYMCNYNVLPYPPSKLSRWMAWDKQLRPTFYFLQIFFLPLDNFYLDKKCRWFAKGIFLYKSIKYLFKNNNSFAYSLFKILYIVLLNNCLKKLFNKRMDHAKEIIFVKTHPIFTLRGFSRRTNTGNEIGQPPNFLL